MTFECCWCTPPNEGARRRLSSRRARRDQYRSRRTRRVVTTRLRLNDVVLSRSHPSRVPRPPGLCPRRRRASKFWKKYSFSNTPKSTRPRRNLRTASRTLPLWRRPRDRSHVREQERRADSHSDQIHRPSRHLRRHDAQQRGGHVHSQRAHPYAQINPTRPVLTPAKHRRVRYSISGTRNT